MYFPLPSAPGDSGLNQFLGGHAYHISQLQGKGLGHGAQLLSLILAFVLELSDCSSAMHFCSLMWADSFHCPVPRCQSKTQSQMHSFATSFRLDTQKGVLHKQAHLAGHAVCD